MANQPGDVNLFMWVCLFLGVFGWPLFFMGLDKFQNWRLGRKVRREYNERNSSNF